MRRCIGGGVHGPAQSGASKPGLWLWQEGFHPFLRSWLTPNFVSNGSSASWGAVGSLDLPQSQRELLHARCYPMLSPGREVPHFDQLSRNFFSFLTLAT